MDPMLKGVELARSSHFAFVFGQRKKRTRGSLSQPQGCEEGRKRKRLTTRKARTRFDRAVRSAEAKRSALVGSWRGLGRKRKKSEIEPIFWEPEHEALGMKLFEFNFKKWLQERRLASCLQRDASLDPPREEGAPCRPFIYFRYTAPDRPDTAQISPGSFWVKAYHGTWFYGLRSILQHGVLLESVSEDQGHEFWKPGLYLTPWLKTANWYARAQNVFNDQVFHRAIVEVLYDPSKKKIYRERGGGQIVVTSDAVAITGLIIQPNSPPLKGEERSERLFLALAHLASCGVEHQDVKPENMMLYDVHVAAFQAELKLGDFGWAAVAPPPGAEEGKVAKPPPTGAGSLWYAPPELNPPVEGIDPEFPALDDHGEPIRGLSDMWSAGVVLYLLLVGHNPFNQALKQPSQELQDQEVLRLVALGNYNRRTERWLQLHPDARDLITKLLRVQPAQRCSATDALQTAFITRRAVMGRVAGYGGNSSAISACMESEPSVFFRGSVAPWAGRERRWARLDGFQRLAWLAMARALSEPELDRSVVQGAMEGMEHERQRRSSEPREAGYLWQLARELGTAPVFQWLQERSAWPDALRLAFAFLDVDGDGALGPRDLVAHCTGPPRRRESLEPAAAMAKAAVPQTAELVRTWIQRWEPKDRSTDTPAAITQAGLREALLASCRGDDSLYGVLDDNEDDGAVGGDTEMEGEERAVRGRGPEEALGIWGDSGGTGAGSGIALSFARDHRVPPLAVGGI
ncbi:CAMK2D [Symbiodinium natans]|uniref:CAMK2D protein n=1 Tax=Symbiodinium natans TaxID=878477 RepID=A0A812LL31_9DINO|nr:CAMK2D [Symbiodinium natans]